MTSLADYWSAKRIPLGGNYGDPRDDGTRKHRGTDYTHGEGVAIPSPTSGTVISKLSPAPSHGFGYQVTLLTPTSGRMSFAHMQGPSSLAIGQAVTTGQILGKEGTTGATTGPCVHVEVNDNGWQNPAPYIARLTQSGTAGGGSLIPPENPYEPEGDDMPVVIYVVKADPPTKPTKLVQSMGFMCYPGGAFVYLGPQMEQSSLYVSLRKQAQASPYYDGDKFRQLITADGMQALLDTFGMVQSLTDPTIPRLAFP